MSATASQITSLTIVYSTVYLGADQIKHQSSASLGFVRGIHLAPLNSPHKWTATRKIFPFDDVIMNTVCLELFCKIAKWWIQTNTTRFKMRGTAFATDFIHSFIHVRETMSWLNDAYNIVIPVSVFLNEIKIMIQLKHLHVCHKIMVM